MTDICQISECGKSATFHSFPANSVHPDERGMLTCDAHLSEGMSYLEGTSAPEHWRVFPLSPATVFTKYRRSQIAELRPYQKGEDMTRISVSAPDKEAGSPKTGDMIARNPKNHDDQWLVAATYFADNFEPLK